MMILQTSRANLSSGDQCSLDLPFAATKSLTARIGPTPTFTRASTATFVGSNGLLQSAAVNAARFDHDPLTLACKGLLIEEGRTNQILQSENFGTTWTVSNALTVTSNSVTAPDGTLTADALNFESNAGTRIIQFAGSAVVHTFSVWLRAAAPTTCIIATTAAGSAGDALTASVTTEWQRFSVVAKTWVTGTTSFACRIVNNAEGTTGTIFIWGAQLEAGSFATSYIPTTTGSVVRSADLCSISGTDFTGFWNRFAGTCVIGVGSSLGTGPRFVSNSLAARTIELYGTTNIDFFEGGGVSEVRIVTSPIYPIKLGLAYAINDYQSAHNGLISNSDTNTGGTVPDATALYIGSLGGSGSRLTGHISSIRYFKKRLPNAKLQTLTT